MQKKNETGKKIPYLFRISWNFSKQIVVKPSWQPLWIIQSSYGSNFHGLSKPISPTYYFLTGFHRNWVWRPTTCLKMLLKMVQNCSIAPIFGWFCYPGMQGTTFVLHSLGIFVRIWGLFLVVSDFAIFDNFCVFRNFCFKHFWKYLNTFSFSGKKL